VREEERVKRRNRERVYFIPFPDWLVREKGEWIGGTERGLLYPIPRLAGERGGESEEEEQREGSLILFPDWLLRVKRKN
jgi:hypothetical protein